MKTEAITSYDEMIGKIKGLDFAYVLLFKKGSEISECCLRNLTDAAQNLEKVKVYTADVNVVRDIHTHYDINTVPTLLSFEKGNFVNTIKGCNDPAYYKSVFENNIFSTSAGERPSQRVTIYTTPTCSWCSTLKNHLKKHGVRYSEIDVSKNQTEAENMTRRSGQRGVPQTDINGTMIVGFDKTRINELLKITG